MRLFLERENEREPNEQDRDKNEIIGDMGTGESRKNNQKKENIFHPVLFHQCNSKNLYLFVFVCITEKKIRNFFLSNFFVRNLFI